MTSPVTGSIFLTGDLRLAIHNGVRLLTFSSWRITGSLKRGSFEVTKASAG
jgi:hypothetical protein